MLHSCLELLSITFSFSMTFLVCSESLETPLHSTTDLNFLLDLELSGGLQFRILEVTDMTSVRLVKVTKRKNSGNFQWYIGHHTPFETTAISRLTKEERELVFQFRRSYTRLPVRCLSLMMARMGSEESFSGDLKT